MTPSRRQENIAAVRRATNEIMRVLQLIESGQELRRDLSDQAADFADMLQRSVFTLKSSTPSAETSRFAAGVLLDAAERGYAALTGAVHETLLSFALHRIGFADGLMHSVGPVAKAGAAALHAETNEFKREFLAWWYGEACRTMKKNQAAEQAARKWPLPERTFRDWLKGV